MGLARTLSALAGNQVTLSMSAFALLVSLAAPRADAALVVSNLDNTLGDAWTIGSDGVDLTDSPVANRFTTGSGPGWHLDSVVLNLGLFELATATGDIYVYLAADDVGLPGTSLTTFPRVAPTTPVEDINLLPDSPTMLAPNTDYWLVASANVDDDYQWNFTEDAGETGLPGWSIGDTA